MRKQQWCHIGILIVTIWCTACLSMVAQIHAKQQKEVQQMEEKTKNYIALSNDSMKDAIIFFGDSITEYCPIEDLYAQDMRANIVLNRGIVSETTAMMKRRMQESVLILKPRSLVMLMGVNDLFAGVNQDEIVQNIKEMIQMTKASSSQTQIILQSIYPINKEQRTTLAYRIHDRRIDNKKIRTVNKALKALAEHEQIDYVDVYDILCDASGNLKETYAFDGLHPNAKGYQVVKEYLIDKLK